MSADYQLRIGLGIANITPEKPLPMQGFANRKGEFTGVYQPIYAKAMAIDDGQSQIVIICADLALWGNSNLEKIRAAVSEKYGLTAAQIIFNVSHTHCGPIVRDAEYAEKLVGTAIDLVDKCMNAKAPAKLFYGRGYTDLGVSRRGKNRDGSIYWGLNPYGPVDREVVVLKVQDMQGKVIGILSNYSCHPSTISGYLIGGDFVGCAANILEEQWPGATALFMQGAGGDVKPYHAQVENPLLFEYGGGPPAAEAVGQKFAAAIAAVLAQPMQEVAGDIAAAFGVVDLPLLNKVVDDDAPAPYQGRKRRMARCAQLMLESMDADGNYLQTKPCEVYVTRIGPDFIMVGLNGEQCVRIGMRIKAQLLPKMALVAGYTGLHIGYVPSMDMIPEKGYEAGVPYSLEAEDYLVDKVIELVGE